MKKGKELSTELKHTIISLALRGYSLRKIGNIVKKPHSTVSYIVNKFKYNGSIKNIPRSRKSFLNEKEKRFIVNKVKVNPRVTAPEIVQMLQQASGKKVSSRTVRRVLWQHGYCGRIPRKRPYVSKKNRAARLAFAREHRDKPQTFWNTVIWSDETKINLFGSDGIQTVWRKANTADNLENTLPTVKHGGGSIKLWGCISSKGVVRKNSPQYMFRNSSHSCHYRRHRTYRLFLYSFFSKVGYFITTHVRLDIVFSLEGLGSGVFRISPDRLKVQAAVRVVCATLAKF
ncbi:hypothetical protein ANN_13934 [Periplaneta americana]|uniref:Transposase Tc1-like domain-containing protein n=1 Tax=Periplaneta americana TaxID=6978 RepID=A0ABQ8SUX1_PERAM|nr:hypothetical protein ANN_13934 [Periplaneta americana]